MEHASRSSFSVGGQEKQHELLPFGEHRPAARSATRVGVVVRKTFAVLGILVLWLIAGVLAYLTMFSCGGYLSCGYRGSGAGGLFVLLATTAGTLCLRWCAAVVLGGRVSRWHPWAWSTACALGVSLVILFLGSPWTGG